MKKVYVMMALAICALSACSKVENNEGLTSPNSITVSMPELVDGNETKTGLVSNGSGYNKLVWTTGDKIYITRYSELYHDGVKHGNDFSYATYNLSAGASTTEATFTPVGPIPGSGKYVAMYTGAVDCGPTTGNIFNSSNGSSDISFYIGSIPSVQSYVENGIAPFTMPMVAYADNIEEEKLNFQFMGDVLRFNLYNGGTPEIQVKNITLTTEEGFNRGNGIAGPFAFTIQTDGTFLSPETAFGVWATDRTGTTTLSEGSRTIYYDCSASDYLSRDSAHPTEFNVVVSRTIGRLDSVGLITASFTYRVSGETEDRVKVIVLNNLTAPKRIALGKIYNFIPAQNVSSWTD